MDLKFTEADADDMTRIIQRHRPGWNAKAIKAALEDAAQRATPGPALTAALRAAGDPTAASPRAILFDKYWTPETSRHAPTGHMLCVECTTKHPANQLVRGPHGWTCTNCTGDTQ